MEHEVFLTDIGGNTKTQTNRKIYLPGNGIRHLLLAKNVNVIMKENIREFNKSPAGFNRLK